MTDPDMVQDLFVIDACETIDRSARSKCTQSQYDGRGRLWRRTDHPDTACAIEEATATWAFDTAPNGIGALHEESSTVRVMSNTITNLTRTSSYDLFGRPSALNTNLRGKTYVESTTYDGWGRPFQSFFNAPTFNGTGEQTEYSADGYAYRVRSAYGAIGLPYSEIQSINARGQVTKEIRLAGAQVTTERAL